MCIKKGQFVGVTGKVGSGKSSLFASITGEMEQYGGKAYLSTHVDEDGIAFFTQVTKQFQRSFNQKQKQMPIK